MNSRGRQPCQRIRGVTLIELVIVIVLLGILGSLMISFVMPMLSYSNARRRAEMTDVADTALRRMARDLRYALPNSVRVSADKHYVEMLLMRTGGRYRSDTGSTGSTCDTGDGAIDHNMLVFGTANEKCFKSIGKIPNASQISTTTDYVVVFNLQPATSDADAYQTGLGHGNNAKVTAVDDTEAGQTRIEFSAGNNFVYESPSQRFQVIEGPVTYACDPTTTNTLTRYWKYTINSAQQTPPPASVADGSPALLASNVSDCAFTYSTIGQADGLVTLSLSITTRDYKNNPETVTLYQTVHVSNVP